MINFTNKPLIVIIALACTFSLASFAQEGFQDTDIRDLLSLGAQKIGVTVDDMINQVKKAIHPGDKVRFMITSTGDLYFLDNAKRLHFVSAAKPAHENTAKALLNLGSINDLKKAVGIACYTDDISAKHVYDDKFEFIDARDPEDYLLSFIEIYKKLHPEPKTEAKETLTKRHKPKH